MIVITDQTTRPDGSSQADLLGPSNLLNGTNVALLHCIADKMNKMPSKIFQQATTNNVQFYPSAKIAVDYALNEFDAFVHKKIRKVMLKLEMK